MHASVRLLLARLWLGVVAGVVGSGCGPNPSTSVIVLTEPVSVVATPSDQPGEERVYRLTVEDPAQPWTIRTCLPPARGADDRSAIGVGKALRQLTAWRPPYLFLRETNAVGGHWRAAVDHVFKVSATNIIRVGTVSARFGQPGSQLQDGWFLDLYDRLEFTLLTARTNAPGFTLAMKESGGVFTVDSAETWRRGQPYYLECRRQLEALAERRENPAGAPAVRDAQAAALQCLALSRYCEQDEESRGSLDLARRAGLDLEALENELALVSPGELAPSADPVLRTQPALMNLFRESSAPVPREGRILPPPSVSLPPAGSGH